MKATEDHQQAGVRPEGDNFSVNAPAAILARIGENARWMAFLRSVG
jgi:hypothetical protein